MKAQSALIVETARREASDAAEQAKMDLQTSIARRLQAAADQIASAEAAAVREVRNSAIGVAVAAAGDMLAKQMTAADQRAWPMPRSTRLRRSCTESAHQRHPLATKENARPIGRAFCFFVDPVRLRRSG